MTVHEQAAGFVLDALDSAEAEEFERHLTLCPDCEEELEPLRVAAAALAFAGELPPPRAELRRRVVVARLRLRPRWQTPLASAAAVAACAALAVGLTGRLNGNQRQTLGLSLVLDGRRAVVVTHGLRPAPRGKVYEIWFTRGDFATPAGFLHGHTTRLPRPVPPGAGVAVTLEPAGGSRRPTGPLLLRTETA